MTVCNHCLMTLRRCDCSPECRVWVADEGHAKNGMSCPDHGGRDHEPMPDENAFTNHQQENQVP